MLFIGFEVVSFCSSCRPQGWKSSIQVSTSFSAKVLWMMLFGVSRKDSGRSDAVKRPKKERNKAASVLLPAPVLPRRRKTNLGSQSTLCRK